MFCGQYVVKTVRNSNKLRKLRNTPGKIDVQVLEHAWISLVWGHIMFCLLSRIRGYPYYGCACLRSANISVKCEKTEKFKNALLKLQKQSMKNRRRILSVLYFACSRPLRCFRGSYEVKKPLLVSVLAKKSFFTFDSS